MKRPMFFFSVPDCGCGGFSPTNSTAPTVICNDKYLTLTKAPKLSVLGIIPDSACQGQFSSKRGFLFDDGTGGGQHIEDKPNIPLPAVIGVDGWKYLMVATGSGANTPWGFAQAPASGEYLLQVQGGLFVFKPVGQMPGMNAIYAAATADEVKLIGGVATVTPGEFDTKRLKPLSKRVVVGTSGGGFKSLTDAEPLEHPEMWPAAMKTKQYSQRDDVGNEIAGGIPVLPLSGSGAVTDAVVGMYSPTTKRFYRAPAPWYRTNTVNLSQPISQPSSLTPLPGGHGVADAATINYPTVEISGFVDLGAEENIDLAIYRGSTLIQMFIYGLVRGHAAVHVIDQNVPLGTHVYSFRYIKGSGNGTGAGTIRQSTITVKTLR